MMMTGYFLICLLGISFIPNSQQIPVPNIPKTLDDDLPDKSLQHQPKVFGLSTLRPPPPMPTFKIVKNVTTTKVTRRVITQETHTQGNRSPTRFTYINSTIPSGHSTFIRYYNTTSFSDGGNGEELEGFGPSTMTNYTVRRQVIRTMQGGGASDIPLDGSRVIFPDEDVRNFTTVYSSGGQYGQQLSGGGYGSYVSSGQMGQPGGSAIRRTIIRTVNRTLFGGPDGMSWQYGTQMHGGSGGFGFYNGSAWQTGSRFINSTMQYLPGSWQGYGAGLGGINYTRHRATVNYGQWPGDGDMNFTGYFNRSGWGSGGRFFNSSMQYLPSSWQGYGAGLSGGNITRYRTISYGQGQWPAGGHYEGLNFTRFYNGSAWGNGGRFINSTNQYFPNSWQNSGGGQVGMGGNYTRHRTIFNYGYGQWPGDMNFTSYHNRSGWGNGGRFFNSTMEYLPSSWQGYGAGLTGSNITRYRTISYGQGQGQWPGSGHYGGMNFTRYYNGSAWGNGGRFINSTMQYFPNSWQNFGGQVGMGSNLTSHRTITNYGKWVGNIPQGVSNVTNYFMYGQRGQGPAFQGGGGQTITTTTTNIHGQHGKYGQGRWSDSSTFGQAPQFGLGLGGTKVQTQTSYSFGGSQGKGQGHLDGSGQSRSEMEKVAFVGGVQSGTDPKGTQGTGNAFAQSVSTAGGLKQTVVGQATKLVHNVLAGTGFGKLVPGSGISTEQSSFSHSKTSKGQEPVQPETSFSTRATTTVRTSTAEPHLDYGTKDDRHKGEGHNGYDYEESKGTEGPTPEPTIHVSSTRHAEMESTTTPELEVDTTLRTTWASIPIPRTTATPEAETTEEFDWGDNDSESFETGPETETEEPEFEFIPRPKVTTTRRPVIPRDREEVSPNHDEDSGPLPERLKELCNASRANGEAQGQTTVFPTLMWLSTMVPMLGIGGFLIYMLRKGNFSWMQGATAAVTSQASNLIPDSLTSMANQVIPQDITSVLQSSTKEIKDGGFLNNLKPASWFESNMSGNGEGSNANNSKAVQEDKTEGKSSTSVSDAPPHANYKASSPIAPALQSQPRELTPDDDLATNHHVVTTTVVKTITKQPNVDFSAGGSGDLAKAPCAPLPGESFSATLEKIDGGDTAGETMDIEGTTVTKRVIKTVTPTNSLDLDIQDSSSPQPGATTDNAVDCKPSNSSDDMATEHTEVTTTIIKTIKRQPTVVFGTGEDVLNGNGTAALASQASVEGKVDTGSSAKMMDMDPASSITKRTKLLTPTNSLDLESPGLVANLCRQPPKPPVRIPIDDIAPDNKTDRNSLQGSDESLTGHHIVTTTITKTIKKQPTLGQRASEGESQVNGTYQPFEVAKGENASKVADLARTSSFTKVIKMLKPANSLDSEPSELASSLCRPTPKASSDVQVCSAGCMNDCQLEPKSTQSLDKMQKPTSGAKGGESLEVGPDDTVEVVTITTKKIYKTTKSKLGESPREEIQILDGEVDNCFHFVDEAY